MGFRNPFRFTVDQTTGWVLSADYGPDAGTTNANRGPQGSVEYNVAHAGGQLWLAVLHPRQRRVQRLQLRDLDVGREVRLRAPVNDSPNNTGLTNLPPASRRRAWMGFSDTDPRFRPTSAPAARRWAARATTSTRTSTPSASSRRSTTTSGSSPSGTTAGSRPPNLDATGAMTKVDPFALGTGYKRPMDLDFGPDGALYVIEWGSGFGGDNADSGVYRVDYVAGDKAPIAEATGASRAASRRSRCSSTPPAPATPRAARSPTRGTSTATARSTRRANPSLHVHHQRRLHGQADRQGRRPA